MSTIPADVRIAVAEAEASARISVRWHGSAWAVVFVPVDEPDGYDLARFSTWGGLVTIDDAKGHAEEHAAVLRARFVDMAASTNPGLISHLLPVAEAGMRTLREASPFMAIGIVDPDKL